MIRNLFGGATKCRTIDKLDIFGDGSCKALYRLDGNANDESGNYHGTETAITYGGGVYERGAVFNGTSSYINTGYTFPYTAFSYSLWYKYGSVNKMILSSVSTNPVKAGQFSLTQDSATQLDLEFINNDSATQTTLLNQTVPNMNDGLFHHIVIAIESGGFMKFYFDGSLINTSSAVPAFVNSNTTALNLMREPRNNYYKDGSLDQIRIFNRAITATEVATLYAECAPTSTVDNINPFEDGSLKALYQFNGDATDKTGVYNGTATNVTYSAGKFGQCAVFNGTNASVINGISDTMLRTNGFTVSFWCTFTDISTSRGLVNNSSGLSSIFEISRGSGNNITFRMYKSDGTTLIFSMSSSFTSTASTWYHITCLWDCTTNTNSAKVYLNGTLFSQTTPSLNATHIATFSGLYIGRRTDGYFHSGSIDQLRIFNKALTPLEVASLYNETTPMEEPMSVQVDPFKDGSGKALYRLEGNALDESGNYNGTPTSVTYGSGRFGRCFIGDITTRYINTNTPSSLFAITANFSISGWYKLSATPNADGSQVVSQFEGNTPNYAGFTINIGNGVVAYGFPDKVSASVGSYSMTSTVGAWYHLVMTFNASTKTSTLYINGVKVQSNTNTNILSSSKSMIIGIMARDLVTSPMNGLIDQVRIFNKTLTQSEVTALYNEI